MERDEILVLDDEKLLAQCRVDTARGRGPGGQKRNKTESAVQLTHIASGISAYNDESRSQHLNRTFTLKHLRLELALGLRNETLVQPGPRPGANSPAFPLWIARVVDYLEANGYLMSDAAAAIGTSTSQLIKALSLVPAVWQFVNARRVALGLQQLKIKN